LRGGARGRGSCSARDRGGRPPLKCFREPPQRRDFRDCAMPKRARPRPAGLRRPRAESPQEPTVRRRSRTYPRARRGRAGAIRAASAQRPDAPPAGGRSFRVNSSERFRGEEAEAPPRQGGKRVRRGRVGMCAHAPTPSRRTRVSTPFHSRRRLATKRQPERLRAERARTSRANPPTDPAGGAPLFAAALAAYHIQETVSHRCRKR
jgi:hypothetical protein